MRVPFLDLGAATREIAAEQAAAIARVVDGGWYVLGPEVERFEAAFAGFCGARHAVGVGNGLDALRLTLQALGIGPGDEVIVPSHTYIATWLGITAAGATPVPVEPAGARFTIGADDVAPAIGPRTAAIMPVHLYGQPAPMDGLSELAARHGLALVADAAQAHGARLHGRPVGAYGTAAAWSFYPSKNLGALGDAGAVTTDDDALAARLRRLRNYGSERKYVNVEQGANSRLDELQAAILSVRLGHLDAWNARRTAIAARYAHGLAGATVALPQASPGADSCWHVYVIRSAARDALAEHLAREGVGTLIHYPIAPHRQQAFAGHALGRRRFPWAERAADEVLSLPIGPQLDPGLADVVCSAVHSFAAHAAAA